jgi:predicted SAM-dependent methyltransferase
VGGLNVQYGAGSSAAQGWLNFDASPTLRLERLPLIGRSLRINAERFPDEIIFGDIVAGLPIAAGSAKAVYASHVLEHLSREDFDTALRNTLKVMARGALFRLVVPDLEVRARLYLERVAAGDGQAADDFVGSTFLGRQSRPRGLKGQARALFGNSDHLWMYDRPAMRRALTEAGFTDVRECRFGDSEDADFAAVEQRDRFFYDETRGLAEVAFQAKKPVTTSDR